ncbi:MAG TPA: ATP synthase F1 subunit delta [Fibrobacteria bacterium]|nr:ATP synthase F1 subunit delta [Fibrobacteria bacterium]
MSKAAPRYAKALLDALVASGELERSLPVLRGLAELPENVTRLLGDPAVSAARRSQALRTALGSPSGESILGRLVSLLSARRRLGEIASIANSLLELRESRSGLAHGVVRSRQPLSPAQVRSLERTLSVAGAEVSLTQETDSSVLGGFKVHLGSTVLDATANNQLNQARRALLSA